MAGAFKKFFDNAGNPYSVENNKLATHCNPITGFKRRLFPGLEYEIQIMKRNLITIDVPLDTKEKQINALLRGGRLSQDEIVLFLKSGRMADPEVEEPLAMGLTSQEHILRVLTAFDAATPNRRPIQNLRTRGELAVKLDNQNLLAVLEDWMEIGFGNDLKSVAARLEPEVGIEKAVELIRTIKTDPRYSDGGVVNRGIKKILLESALEKALNLDSRPSKDAMLEIAKQWRGIVAALEDVGGIPAAAEGQFAKVDGQPPLFERYVRAVSDVSFMDGMDLLGQLQGEVRKAALFAILPPSGSANPEALCAFLSDGEKTAHFTPEELMHVAKQLIRAKNADGLVEEALKNQQLPDNVVLGLLKAKYAVKETDSKTAVNLNMLEAQFEFLLRMASPLPKAVILEIESGLQELRYHFSAMKSPD